MNSSLLPESSECIHTSCYCEENVWLLCRHIKENHPSHLESFYVIFISNENKTIPLWRQKSGREGFVIWDYHVILIQKTLSNCRVYDLDSTLTFPCRFDEYLQQSIQCDTDLPAQFQRRFRLVPSEDFLDEFASDRSHMRDEDGSWMKPPPSYSPIRSKSSSHNLDLYINVNCNIANSEVLDYCQLSERF